MEQSKPTSATASEQAADGEFISIRGARVHNLKGIDVDIPRNQLVVITGVSGSGKSSLAIDTIFAEGQRQYIQSLSVYARQFVHQMERPDVDFIEGLQPTIAIDQRAGYANPRSTVATVTEIYDYLRLLVSRLGTAYCYQCGTPIRQQSPEEINAELLQFPAGTKIMVLAPMLRGRKGQHQEVFEAIRKAGFQRARVDGEVLDIGGEPPELAPRKNHTIEAVVDRIVIREGIDDRLAESLNLAITHGEGSVLVASQLRDASGPSTGPWRDQLFSTLYACPNCKINYEELEPRTFSFNSPYGACPTCEGLGAREEFDPELLLGDEQLSLAKGLVVPWKNDTPAQAKRHQQALAEFLQAHHLTWDTPYAQWKPSTREKFLRGTNLPLPARERAGVMGAAESADTFLGLLTLLEKEFATATKVADQERLAAFRGQVVCQACGGARLRPEARSVRIGGKAIHEITALTVQQASRFFEALPSEIAEDDSPIFQPLSAEISSRLAFLEQVGLNYLTLDRAADTLSGGELQRVRLATGIGSGLVGVCYVLDEPSIGLHPRDNQRLIVALRDLQSQGNTVLVVEHDADMMRQADDLLDLGPGAGAHGGHIVAHGPPTAVAADPNSLTGRYLSGAAAIPVSTERRRGTKTRSITLEGVTTNNLKNVDARFPLGVFICITGVSGSGKSSLINETLARALVRRLAGQGPKPGPHTSLRGVNQIDKIIVIDQAPIGRSPRSNPATYVGIFDEIRKVFASTPQSKERGYTAGRFSFNVPAAGSSKSKAAAATPEAASKPRAVPKGGRCEECQGYGAKKIEMQFLPDLYVTCPVCEGKRFNRQTLEVKFKNLSIADVLDLRIDEAAAVFENIPLIARPLRSLQEVGLGYLTLGQSATTLSGGEAQRVKLATELARVETGSTLYLLDEPTTGLHFDDVRKLLEVLQRLVDLGNTVMVIEHNLDVMKCADWIIDLGPEGGEAGGYIVAEGTPEEVAALPDNHTGRLLKPLLGGAP
ncbi:MAG TPA: excinuclease ABC subunit UvrA [Pirellulales bacterium]|jgi:excinuclease ABC subunit A|nr:excinuclease ABC subunit UvrA [Pirellulales bacterium]